MTTLFLDCWKELELLRKTLIELRAVNERGREFYLPARRAHKDASAEDGLWLVRARQTRQMADDLPDSYAKLLLLDLAEAYQVLADDKGTA